ncbi:MAG: type II toxin-antitoxin system RelE/ParE family toxin [Desulfobulbaceae bacterium]|nr:type II toxin-antitoxin system RelE/ParE family toxin [Desulfobulbaceae bacterium]
METKYRKIFLKDLKRLKNLPISGHVYKLAFKIIPEADSIMNVSNIKSMKGYTNRYRIRIGNYRIGIEVHNDIVDIMRVLHRKEFYRYFP